MALADYLSSVTADYSYMLDLPCAVSLPKTGNKNQIIHEFDDGSVGVASMSDNSWYDVVIEFDVLTEAEADELFELYNNPVYANGSERTFYWQHPSDGNIYTVRFMSPVEIVERHDKGPYFEASAIQLRVEGIG